MTVYRLAKNPGEYASAHSLLREEGGKDQKLSFPTVLALGDDRKLVGFLGTTIQDKMIVAGPLILKSDRRRVRAAIRLIDFYEITLRALGVSRYIFYTEENSIIDKGLKRINVDMEPYAVENGIKFFVRRLN